MVSRYERRKMENVMSRFNQSVKRLPDIPRKICFREIAAEIGQMWHRFHEHDKKQNTKNTTNDTARAINVNRKKKGYKTQLE